MVDRALPPVVQAQLEKFNLYHAILVHIDFEGGHVRITDNFQDVTYDGNDYEAAGGFLDIGSIDEDAELRNNSTQLKMSALTGVMPAILLGENVINRPVTVTRVFLDDNHQIDAAVLLLKGSIAAATLDDSNGDDATITIASHWANFDKVSGRRTNSTSQQRHFPNDTAFRFAALGDREVKWGRT